MAKDLATNSLVEIVSFHVDHLTVTTKELKSFVINKTRWCKYLYESVQRGVEYFRITKVKLNPMLQQIHLHTPIIRKTRHLTVRTQSALKSNSNKHIIDFCTTNFTMVRLTKISKTFLHRLQVICKHHFSQQLRLHRKSKL
jgi:hypothetical protein